MKATDVYNIAKALPPEEFTTLYNMLGKILKEKSTVKKPRKPMPKFTVDDGIRYLLENHFNKIKEV